MKIFLAIFSSIYLIISFPAFSLEEGKWNFVKTDEYCYIGSLAIETDLSSDKKRGDYYILVYKNIGNPETIIQIEAGYDYKLDSKINVQIDKGDYEFYTTKDIQDAAWTEEDNKVIYAMKKGLKLKVTGESSRGTITNDIYTLDGFTISFNKLIEDC
tara:strand:+ start:541 stop:1011 length:471 start_codon:yes stop_codon:yes gene_type:complete